MVFILRYRELYNSFVYSSSLYVYALGAVALTVGLGAAPPRQKAKRERSVELSITKD